ncbi:hypothetical protein, partial [Burkholderia thailandensis]|uniref:hypothetical protein n=1 Tax=Burkholderia thailandensis TaxID=57975 RepID=UPI0021C7E3B0
MTGDRMVERCADCTAMSLGGRGYRLPFAVVAGRGASLRPIDISCFPDKAAAEARLPTPNADAKRGGAATYADRSRRLSMCRYLDWSRTARGEGSHAF